MHSVQQQAAAVLTPAFGFDNEDGRPAASELAFGTAAEQEPVPIGIRPALSAGSRSTKPDEASPQSAAAPERVGR